MTNKLPRISANELIKVVEKLGFFLARQSGSHKIFKNINNVRLVIPYHSNKTIHPKIIKSIIISCKLTVEEFKKLL